MTEEKQISAVPSSEQQDAQTPPAVHDKRRLPEGVVPKQAQGYVMAGLAVLILLAVMFSKNHAKPAPKETPQSAVSVSTDMNQRKIQELEQNLSADQRLVQQQRAGARCNCSRAVPRRVSDCGTQVRLQLPQRIAIRCLGHLPRRQIYLHQVVSFREVLGVRAEG